MLRLLVFLTVVFAFGCASSQPMPASTASASLQALIVGASELPAGCTARPLNDEAPSFLSANPMAADEAGFIRGVSEMAFRGDGPADEIEEAMIGVYDGTHELGLFAFRFTNTEIAEQARDFAERNEEGQEILLDGTTLVVIWRDGPEDACFQTLANHAKQTLGVE